jgi:hypothetical protein
LPDTTEGGGDAAQKDKTIMDEKDKAESKPFALKAIQLEVPRGKLSFEL